MGWMLRFIFCVQWHGVPSGIIVYLKVLEERVSISAA
jgi:hypothetical protein